MEHMDIKERSAVEFSKEDKENNFETSEQLFEIKEISVIRMLKCNYSPSCDCAAH